MFILFRKSNLILFSTFLRIQRNILRIITIRNNKCTQFVKITIIFQHTSSYMLWAFDILLTVHLGLYLYNNHHMFRANIQPIIKRLRVQCGNNNCLHKCLLCMVHVGTESPTWTIDSRHLRKRSSLPHCTRSLLMIGCI
jgi:hypothetical protein